MDTIARGLALRGNWPYVSGRYYSPDGILTTAGGATAGVAGSIYITPGIIRRSVSINTLVVNLTTGSSGGLFQISLYGSDPVTGYPTGAPLFTSSSQSTTTATRLSIAASLTLVPGIYWLAIQADNAVAIFGQTSSAWLIFNSILGSTGTTSLINAGSSNATGLTKTGTFGTWPTLTGNITTDSLTETTIKCPQWAFKVA